MPRLRPPVWPDDQRGFAPPGLTSNLREDQPATPWKGEARPAGLEPKTIRSSAPTGRKPRILVSAGTPSDGSAITRFVREFSIASLRSRSFESVNDEAILAETARENGFTGRCHSVVARDRDSARVVGHALAVGDSDDSAQVALAVAEECQGNGIGIMMLDHLVQEARLHGVRTLWAVVRADKGRMLDILARAGYDLESNPQLDCVRAIKPL